MLEILGTLFSSILGGGVTGLLGVVIQRFADYKNKQLDMQLEKQRGEIELLKRDKDREIMREEWGGRLRVAAEEGAAAKDVAETQAFAASLLREPERWSNAQKLSPAQQWVMVTLDALRGVVRPGLTIYLCFLTTYVWVQVRAELGEAKLSDAAALDVWRLVVGTILYLTTTVVLWWFGTRNKQEQPGSLRIQ